MLKSVCCKTLACFVCAFTLCACGANQQSGEEAVRADSESVRSEAEAADTEKIGEAATADPASSVIQESEIREDTSSYPVSEIGALNVENDTFDFATLVLNARETESSVRSYLNLEDGQKSENVVLFGINADLTLNVSDDAESSLFIQFSEADLNELQNAISEQLGIDGEERNGLTVWIYEDRTVTLYQEDVGCIINIA